MKKTDTVSLSIYVRETVFLFRKRNHPRYIKVKVEHYLLFKFSPPKISWVISGIKYICLHFFPVFYLMQPSSKQIVLISENKIVCYLYYSMYLFKIVKLIFLLGTLIHIWLSYNFDCFQKVFLLFIRLCIASFTEFVIRLNVALP